MPSGQQYGHLRLVDPTSASLDDRNPPGRILLNAYCVVVGCVATGLGVRLATAFGIDRAPARIAMVGAVVVMASIAGGVLADTILQLPQRFTRLLEDSAYPGSISRRSHGSRGEEDLRMLAEEQIVVEAAEVVSEALEEQAVSRKEFADRLDMRPSHVSELLSGERDLTIRDLAVMLHVLGYQLAISLSPAATRPAQRTDVDDL